MPTDYTLPSMSPSPRVAVLVLAAAVLVKYLFFEGRRGRDG